MYQVVEEKFASDGFSQTTIVSNISNSEANRIAQLMKEDADANTYYVVYPM